MSHPEHQPRAPESNRDNSPSLDSRKEARYMVGSLADLLAGGTMPRSVVMPSTQPAPKEAEPTIKRRFNPRRYENVTPESLKDYFTDRRRDNYSKLNEADPVLADTYLDIVTAYDGLDNVELINFDTRKAGVQPNAAFSCLKVDDSGNYRPVVSINFKEPDVYFMEKSADIETSSLLPTVKKVAFDMGVDPREALHNKRFMASFTLLHEFGHALDFKRNYLDKANGDIKQAVIANRRQRARDEATRLINYLPKTASGEIDTGKATRLYGKRLHVMGLCDKNGRVDPLLVAKADRQVYRRMHSEVLADAFAHKYILEHMDKFFTDKPTNLAHHDERLEFKIDKRVHMDNDFAEILNWREGEYVSATFVGNRDNRLADRINKSYSGYISQTPTIGQPLILQKGNIPDNPLAKGNVGNKITDVWYVPRSKPTTNGKKIVVETYYADDSGNTFRLDKAKPPETDVPPIASDNAGIENINRLLGFQAGSDIRLLKRRLNGSVYDSQIKDGDLVQGKLLTNGLSKNGVRLVGEDGAIVGTSEIQCIGRIWRTYYIKTATSIYEVLSV